MIKTILSLLSLIVILYTILCFIDILLTWIPGAKFTKFGKFVSKVCDPYMNFFSKRGWLRFRNLDFSPIISIGILSLLSSILGSITSTGRISLGHTLAMIVSLVSDIASSLIGLFFLLIFIRWIVLLVKHGQTDYNSIWNQVDSIIGNFCRKLSGSIVRKPVKYQTALLVTWIVTLLIFVLFGNVMNLLTSMCLKIPF